MDIASYARVTERADQDGVEVSGKIRESVLWDRGAIAQIAISAPIESRQVDGYAACFNHLGGLRDNFFPNPVAGNDSNPSFRAHGKVR